jgi:hypothetical protein
MIMTLEERIEAAARVIDQDAFEPLPGHGPGECEHCDRCRFSARAKARAVAEALAVEPTDTMLLESGNGVGDAYDRLTAYKAMRDAYLGAKP